MDDDILELLRRLLEAGVEFVVVGGIAAAIHGSETDTQDVDIVSVFSRENMARLLDALRDIHPRNAARPGLGSIPDDPDLLARHRNLYLLTDLGRLDILGELPPLSGYAEVAAAADKTQVFGHTCAVINIDQLITIKRSVARRKDLIVADELEAIRAQLAKKPHSAS